MLEETIILELQTHYFSNYSLDFFHQGLSPKVFFHLERVIHLICLRFGFKVGKPDRPNKQRSLPKSAGNIVFFSNSKLNFPTLRIGFFPSGLIPNTLTCRFLLLSSLRFLYQLRKPDRPNMQKGRPRSAGSIDCSGNSSVLFPKLGFRFLPSCFHSTVFHMRYFFVFFSEVFFVESTI